jgi:hypothetical protein
MPAPQHFENPKAGHSRVSCAVLAGTVVLLACNRAVRAATFMRASQVCVTIERIGWCVTILSIILALNGWQT